MLNEGSTATLSTERLVCTLSGGVHILSYKEQLLMLTQQNNTELHGGSAATLLGVCVHCQEVCVHCQEVCVHCTGDQLLHCQEVCVHCQEVCVQDFNKHVFDPNLVGEEIGSI